MLVYLTVHLWLFHYLNWNRDVSVRSKLENVLFKRYQNRRNSPCSLSRSQKLYTVQRSPNTEVVSRSSGRHSTMTIKAPNLRYLPNPLTCCIEARPSKPLKHKTRPQRRSLLCRNNDSHMWGGSLHEAERHFVTSQIQDRGAEWEKDHLIDKMKQLWCCWVQIRSHSLWLTGWCSTRCLGRNSDRKNCGSSFII